VEYYWIDESGIVIIRPSVSSENKHKTSMRIRGLRFVWRLMFASRFNKPVVVCRFFVFSAEVCAISWIFILLAVSNPGTLLIG